MSTSTIETPLGVDPRDRGEFGDMSPSFRHQIGDHRDCGASCRSHGKDLRSGLGVYEKVLLGHPDPATIDDRLRLERAAATKKTAAKKTAAKKTAAKKPSQRRG